ncbi:MAG: tetratricopeptide repeat protein [Polyangiaceae bacterium]|nr:tetratricopeptide repeat protein [Polyangiaceae bacterium]
MKLGWLSRSLLLGSFVLLLGDPGFAQFDPRGRHRSKPKAGATTSKRPPSQAKPSAPSTPPQTSTATEPKSEALIARYTGIVLSQPEAQFPIRRLSDLYRQRDGKLDRLIAEFEERARADTDEGARALVALAGILRQAGNYPEAQATYEQAILKRPKDPAPELALAELFKEQGDFARARQGYERALLNIKAPSAREPVLRTLLTLCLDLEDYACATESHRGLVKVARGSILVEAELGRELLQRARYERAVDEFRRVVRLAAGDNRVLLPALRDLGRALAKAGKTEDALTELHKALNIAGQSGIVTEVYQTIGDIYRGQNRLPELIRELELRGGKDWDRQKLLAELYEETGRLQDAQKTYVALGAQRPKDVATRLKIISLLELEGNLKGAISEYEKLRAAEPRNPNFVFRLVEALLQQGERARALTELETLEQRASGDEQVLTTLVNFYERLGNPARATQILEKITSGAGRDPRHLVELGSRYWEADDKNRAQKTWKLVEHAGSDRAANLLILGDVYLQHDLTSDALFAYREARKLRPNDRAIERAYALALERAGAQGTEAARRRFYQDAGEVWFGLLKKGSPDRHAQREARAHIVTLWSLDHSIEGRPQALRLQLEQKPPNLEAGRLLAEVQIKLGQPEQAETTLRKVLALAPGDIDGWLTLEKTLAKLGRLEQALRALEQLVILDPTNARQYYQRMAEHAGALYRDKDALRYAARALELNPDDAEGHRRLGEMYRKRNLPQLAIDAFRKAISKNDRLFAVYFDLADLLLSEGQATDADRLMRRVMRTAVDDELLARAVRMSSQINVSAGTLPDLERELFQVTLSHPNKPLYRELLIELYGTLAFPLISAASGTDPEVQKASELALAELGERAVKPLLDALIDPKSKQKQIAIELLSYIHNQGAGPALVTFATGDSDVQLRTRAMLAAANLKDPSLLPRFEQVLFVKGKSRAFEGDPVSVAAAFAIATLPNSKAAPLLVSLLKTDSPSIKAVAALGLGALKYKPATATLVSLCRSTLNAPVVRAAAARALAQMGDKSTEVVLKELVGSSEATLRQSALLALASLSQNPDPTPFALALLDSDRQTQQVAKLASLIRTTRRTVWSNGLASPRGSRVDALELLELAPNLTQFSNTERAQAMLWLSPTLLEVATSQAGSSVEAARTVAQSIGGTRTAPLFLPLMDSTSGIPSDLEAQVSKVTQQLVVALVEPFEALVTHPESDIRRLALEFLGQNGDDRALAAVVRALNDPSESVRFVALNVLTARKAHSGASEIAKVLTEASSWVLRLRAAQALESIGVPANTGVLLALRARAQKDPYALVRGASLQALSVLDRSNNKALLEARSRVDPDEDVRNTARTLLQAP